MAQLLTYNGTSLRSLYLAEISKIKSEDLDKEYLSKREQV